MLCSHMKAQIRKIWSILFLVAFVLLLGSCEKSDLVEPDFEPVKFTKSSGGDGEGDSDDNSDNYDDITDDEDDQDDGDITDDEDDQDDSGSRSANAQSIEKE